MKIRVTASKCNKKSSCVNAASFNDPMFNNVDPMFYNFISELERACDSIASSYGASASIDAVSEDNYGYPVFTIGVYGPYGDLTELVGSFEVGAWDPSTDTPSTSLTRQDREYLQGEIEDIAFYSDYDV